MRCIEYLKGVKKLKCFIIMIYLQYNKGKMHVEVYMGMGISHFSRNLLVEPKDGQQICLSKLSPCLKVLLKSYDTIKF